MKAKRFIYSILLAIFSLILAADLAVFLLVPWEEPASVAEETTAFSVPEGKARPEEGGFSADNLPAGRERSEGEDGGEEGSRRRARRQEESEEEAPASLTLPGWVPAQIQALLPLLGRIRPYCLHILIGTLLCLVLCVLRLVAIGKKLRQQAQDKAAEPILARRVPLWPAVLLLLGALALVVFLFPVNGEEAEQTGAVSITRLISGAVEAKGLTSLIQSAGSLSEQEAQTLTIPASVSVSAACVRNGDFVTAGQILAQADRSSVMQAIASVHEALDQIDGQLQSAHEMKADATLAAPVAGIVKAVYAQAGETVMDVMNEHGALMLLSLDGRMAVRVSAADGLRIGSQVTVTLSDGTELLGEVTFLEEGVATVTVADRGYAIGETVSVKGTNGAILGSGPLFVHKALNITGYLGTISRIYRGEGSAVYAGAPLIGLTDTADEAEYAALLRQRGEYEAELQTLFELYETGYIHAPCDGVVTGLSDAIPYVSLTQMVAGFTVRPLAADPSEAEPADYIHYVGQVLENAGGLLSLQVGASPVTVESFTALPALPAATMTGTYTIPGSSPIYRFSGGWSPISAGDILVGDKVLFTFDENGSLVWVIVERTAGSATPGPPPRTSTPADQWPSHSTTVTPVRPVSSTALPTVRPGTSVIRLSGPGRSTSISSCSRRRASGGGERLGVGVGLEADQQLAVDVEHRPLDHRRLRRHQGQRPVPIDINAVGLRQLAERRAGTVEQNLPTRLVGPRRQAVCGDPLDLVVVEDIGDAVGLQPGPGLLHRVAGLDAVDGDGGGLGHGGSFPRGGGTQPFSGRRASGICWVLPSRLCTSTNSPTVQRTGSTGRASTTLSS